MRSKVKAPSDFARLSTHEEAQVEYLIKFVEDHFDQNGHRRGLPKTERPLLATAGSVLFIGASVTFQLLRLLFPADAVNAGREP